MESPDILRSRFLTEVKRKADRLLATEILALVLVGYGSADAFMLGDPDVEGGSCELYKPDLEEHLIGTKGTIWLIHTGCQPGSWESSSWFLLTATDVSQGYISIRVSGSDEARGSFLANALITKRDLCPGGVNTQGIRGEQLPHDSGVDGLTRLVPLSLIRTSKRAQQWIHEWKDRRDRTYVSARLGIKPSSESQLDILPFRLFDSASTTYRFRCVPPSTINSSLSLSFAEQAQLRGLALDFMQSIPITVPRNVGTILTCNWVVKGLPLPQEEQFQLLSNLKDRKRLQELAMAIAENLGLQTGVTSVGRAGAKDFSPNSVLQKEAEAAGCLVSTVLGNQHPVMRYVGAADWLALVWEAEGRPTVDSALWHLAYTQAIAERF